MKHWLYLGLASGLLAAACGDDGGTPADARILVDAPHDGTPACGLARIYVSEDELECGLGPPGSPPPLCPWIIELGTTAPDSFQWFHSDVVEAGTFTCIAGILRAHPAGGGTIEARYSAGSPTLTWDGVRYTRGDLGDAGVAAAPSM